MEKKNMFVRGKLVRDCVIVTALANATNSVNLMNGSLCNSIHSTKKYSRKDSFCISPA